jgi:hypothetical protein
MVAVRRVPKGPSGGHGRGAGPPGGDRFFVKRWGRFRPANDNAPIHGGRKALWVSVGIVLTLGTWALVLRASA